MESFEIDLDQHPYFNKEAQAYYSHDKALSEFYVHSPNLESVERVVEKKEKSFSQAKRQVLVEALLEQYKPLKLKSDSPVQTNILSLLEPNTFTVTTGQQIHPLFGPLFFLYKALSAIGTSNVLNQNYPKLHFVPIFWMASEDHDFDEIKHIKAYNNTLTWDEKSGPPVGRLSPKNLVKLCDELENILDGSDENKQYIALFRKAYGECKTFGEATLQVLTELTAHTGLIVLEPDNSLLKQEMKSLATSDLLQNGNKNSIEAQTKKLKQKSFKPQIGAQATNFFYLTKDERVKIKKKGSLFLIGDLELDKAALIELIDSNIEDFSPNVALRPLFQETILPNVIYIAGTSELRYWLQILNTFKLNHVDYPMVLLRKSALIMRKKNYKRIMSKLDTPSDLFQEDQALIKKYDKKLKEKLNNVKLLVSDQFANHQATVKSFNDLPLKRLPFSAFKAIDKALNQLNLALEEIDGSQSQVSEEVQDIIHLRNKFIDFDKVQERNTNLVSHFGELYSMLHEIEMNAFTKTIQILIV
jgi:bacillithiol synthase